MDQEGFRILTKHCLLVGRDADQTYEWLLRKYGETAPPKIIVLQWYTEHKSRHNNTNSSAPSSESSSSKNNKQSNKNKRK